MTNVSALEKIAEHMQWMEENSPRVVALQYSLKLVGEKMEDGEKRIAELESRCAALAAENAGLKSKAAELVHEASEVYSAYNSTITEPDGDFMDMQTLQEMQCVETQATDAFLAEVRAKGVDAAIEELNQLAERSEKEAPIAAEHHRSAALYMKLFAAQLRKGVQS